METLCRNEEKLDLRENTDSKEIALGKDDHKKKEMEEEPCSNSVEIKVAEIDTGCLGWVSNNSSNILK